MNQLFHTYYSAVLLKQISSNVLGLLFFLVFLLSGTLSAQNPFTFWENESNVHASFSHNPAYRIQSRGAIAAMSNVSTHVSTSSSPVFFMLDDVLETNGSLWLNQGFGSSGILTMGDIQTSSTLFSNSDRNFTNRFLSQRSETMIFSFLTNEKSPDELKQKSVFRMGFFLDRSADFKYGPEFVEYLDGTNFSNGTSSLMIEDLGDSRSRYISQVSVEFGQSIEVSPLRCHFGWNLSLIGGLRYFDADVNGDRTALEIVRSGYDFDTTSGRFFEIDNFLSGYGGALDLGMSYRLNRTWTAHASLLDFGLINWGGVERGVTNKPELIYSANPLNVVFDQYEGDPYTNEEVGEVPDGSSESLQTRLDDLVTIGLSNQGEIMGIHFMASKGLTNVDVRPDDLLAALKLSVKINRFSDFRLTPTLGSRFGNDTNLSFSIGSTIDYQALGIYIGLDGLFSSSDLVSRNLLLFGVQFSPKGSFSLKRI